MPTLSSRTEAGGRCEDRDGGAQGDGMEKVNKCDHFTIRGYVADVRKQDAKICWPLSVPHNQTLDVLANSLPPLIVPDFGRWYCQNCLDSRITSDEAKRSATVTIENDDASTKDFSIVFKNDADNLLSNFRQQSKIGTSRIEVAEVGTTSINADDSEISPLVCHSSKELQNLRKESTTGSYPYKLIHSGSEGNQHQPSKSAVAAAEHNSFESEENIRKNTTVYMNNLNASPYNNNTNNLVCVKRSEIDLNRTYEGGDISDGALTYNRTDTVASCHGDRNISVGVKTKLLCDDVARKNSVVFDGSCTRRDDPLSTTLSPSTNQANLDQIKDKVACSMDLSIGVHHKKHEREAGSSNGKLNYKKARKIRLRSLEDIMRKDESCVPKDLCYSKGDAESPKTKGVHDAPCRLNCEAKHSCQKSLNCKTGESATVKSSLVGSQAGENNDEDTSLKHWLMSVSKKSIADKGSSLTRHTKDIACNSVGTSNQKDAYHKEKSSRERPQQKDVNEKENKRPQIQPGNPCLGSQQNLRSDDEWIKFVHSKTSQTIIRNGIPEKTSHIDHHDMDEACDETFDSNKKPKRKLQVGDGSSSSKLSKKVMTKKQRTTTKTGKEILEDIPMDVVEILAKIQHERHTSAKFSSDINYSMPVSNDSYISGDYKSNGWNEMHTNLDISNDTPHALHIRNKNFQAGQEVCNSSKHHKRNLHIDLNQQVADSHQAMSDCIGHNSFESPPAFDYLKQSHSCQHLPLDKVKMQHFGSCHKYPMPFPQDSSRTVPDMRALPRNDRIFGANMRMSCPEQNYVNMESHDSFPEGRRMTVVEKSEEARKSTNAYVMNAEQSTGRVFLPFETHHMEGQNPYHFGNVELSGSCSNGTVSATNLLRLVNQAAFSGASLDRNSVGNSGARCNSRCSVICESEVGIRDKEMPNGPWRDAYSSQDQIPRGFSQPHRPVARIGIFGPLLQDEITTHTNKYGTTVGSEVRQADEMPYLQISGGKAEFSYSPIHLSCRNMDDTVSMRSMPTVSAGSSLVQGYSSSRYGRDHSVISWKEKAVCHARNTCATEHCVINRNPADFTLPDDDNEYMREVKI